jgi:hypothetical protein
MARHLSDADISLAVRLLDGWTGKLTWERYRVLLATELDGALYTKAGLRKQPRILNAWEATKRRLKGSMEAGVPSNGDAAIAQLQKRVQRLLNTIARLEQENQDLLVRFERWSHNAAFDKGMTLKQLDRHIVFPGRGDGRPKVAG